MKIGIIHHDNAFKDVMRSVIHRKTDHDVIWRTNYGMHALELCKQQRPHLILLDPHVIEYDGIEFVSDLVSCVNCPVMIVTDNLDESSYWVFEAMSHGALDVVECHEHEYDLLVQKIQRMAPLVNQEKVVRSPREKETSSGVLLPSRQLILFGASTGGPLALASILASFPQNLNASVVIVQHVNESFSKGLGDWLESRTPLPVEIVQGETTLCPGKVYLSDAKWHLIMNEEKKLTYTSQAHNDIYKPSIDVFFESVAKHWKQPSVAVLLTGMGADGAAGLKALKDKGWMTIAEDESSCVVYGMPKAAIEMRAAKEVLDLHQIPLALLSYLKRNNKRVTS